METLELTPQTEQVDGQPSDLTEQILSGDTKAFEVLVLQESPRLYRVIRRILNDQDEAKSVLQETFLQAWQRLGSFRKESKLSTWLYAIGINLARASLRKSRRLSSLDDLDVDRLQPGFDRGMFTESVDSWNPHLQVEREDRRKLVHEAIDRLPSDYRMVVILRDIEEHSTEEVAQILDISEGAVRVRLHRARQALRKLLDIHFHSESVSRNSP